MVCQHSYMKYLYKYPQSKFPYEDLIEENARRSRLDKEYNILDTGIFDSDRYFDIFIEVAKEANNAEELLCRVTAYNRGPRSGAAAHHSSNVVPKHVGMGP